MQIGHSSGGGGSSNSRSSYNSAARFSHVFLCFDRCFFLQAALQYFTKSHLLHLFMLSPPSLPQLAHIVIVSSLFDSSPLLSSEDNAPERSALLLLILYLYVKLVQPSLMSLRAAPTITCSNNKYLPSNINIIILLSIYIVILIKIN